MKSFQLCLLLALIALVSAAPVAQLPGAPAGGDPITAVLNEVIGLLTSLLGGLGGGVLRAREVAAA